MTGLGESNPKLISVKYGPRLRSIFKNICT